MEQYKKLLTETVNVNTGRGRKPATVRNYLYMLNNLSNQLTDKDIGSDNLSFLLNTAEVLQFIIVTHNPTLCKNTKLVLILYLYKSLKKQKFKKRQ